MSNMPAAEVDIDRTLVRCLLAEQHPDMADHRIRLVQSGWDNMIFRLGDDLVVRLPRRSVAAPLIEHEQRWLPSLAPRLSLPIPVALRVGRPGCGYPWAWSVARWFDGSVAATSPPIDAGATAVVLGRFLAELHQPAPPNAPANPYRGVPLADRAEVTAAHLEAVVVDLERREIETLHGVWEHALARPPWNGPSLWLHGDLHPANLLVHAGALSAVIDFGDLTAGDPATDLAVAWMLLPTEARSVLRETAGGDVGIDDDTWARARGWALAHGAACVASSADSPLIGAMGRRTLANVLADPD